MGIFPRVIGLLIALWGACAGTARADTYEWQRTEKVLKTQGLTIAEAPEGKRIAWIRIVRDDVFVRDEVWPVFLNVFHGRTREQVVRRELLFAEGGPYQDARIEETMRNLRGMGIFALVRIVAVQTEDPGAVGVLVHTRDLWSLRVEQAFNITTQVNSLMLTVTERNLFGRNKTIGMDYLLVPKTYMLRQFYYARRVLGSNVSLSQNAGVIFNRLSGNAEGNVSGLSVGEPFYRLSQRYAWSLDGGYSNQMVRSVSNGVTEVYQPAEHGPYALRAYRKQNPTASISAYFRRGHSYKQTFGIGWDYRQVQAYATSETALPDALRAGFERDVLPLQRREIGPTLSYDLWLPRFVTFVNLGTYGQSENVRVGPSVSLTARAPLSAFGSSSNSWVLGSSYGVVAAPGGGLLEVRVGGSTRYENDKLVDQHATALVRGASPIFGVFRLVVRGTVDLRRRDTQKTFVTLGSDSGLRGYPSQFFNGYGASKILGNVELRTLPIEWEALHVGGVVFYDVGSVFTDAHQMQMHYAAGVGIRFLFPQFSRYPFALDGGMSADPSFRFVPTFSSSQVVPLTATEDAL